jgi:chromosome segregation ATPase
MTAKKDEFPLRDAASAFEDELRRHEVAVAELERLAINSDKALQRARKALEECASREEALAKHLVAFVEAMRTAQERQQKCMEATLGAANRVKERFDARNALLARVASLGESAKAIVADTAPDGAANATGDSADAKLKSFQDIASRIETVIEETDAVTKAAQEDDWADISRETESLKQQLQSARNKMLVATRALASRAPS